MASWPSHQFGVLGQPVFAHLTDCTFLAGPVPALTEWPSSGACRLEQSRYDFINWLATAEQGSADRDLGGMDSVLPGALVAHGGEPLLDIDGRLETQPFGHGEPRVELLIRAMRFL